VLVGWMSMLVGGLFAAGFYLLLRRSLVRIVLGLSIFSYGANLLILTAGNAQRAAEGVQLPIVAPGESVLIPPYADPLPQALVLTAIVIGFGLQAFTLVLARAAYQRVGADDVDVLRSSDLVERPTVPTEFGPTRWTDEGSQGEPRGGH
jgi:multicomponent Na+:H+ antiporter subunit C